MTENEKAYLKECSCPEILGLWLPKNGDAAIKSATLTYDYFLKHCKPSLEQIVVEIGNLLPQANLALEKVFGLPPTIRMIVSFKDIYVEEHGETYKLAAIKALKQVLKEG